MQGEVGELAVYLGQPQSSDAAWLLTTLSDFVASYDQALQGLGSQVRPSCMPSSGPCEVATRH